MKLLVVVYSVIIAFTVTAQERVVFEAGGTNGWSMFPHIETDSIYCAPTGDILRLAKGQTLSRAWFWLALSEFNEADDYRIETRLRQTNGDIYNGFGVVYGYQDPNNYACFMISSWKQAKLASSENGRWYDWRDMLQLKAIKPMGEWNTIVLEKKNKSITFKINDTVVITAPAPKVIGKGIGFLTHAPLAFEVEYLRLTQAPSGKLKTAPALVATETLPNATMRFHNILFAPGKTEVRATTYGELNQVLGFLRSNTQVTVEIGGHTDNLGSNATNRTLSEARAKAVKSYLVNKGISPSRITAKGYGEAQPIASNSSEAGRQKNRRVEFRLSTGPKD
jgi:outer membrane protein OmpA-like peptidoglycan-associated protein